MKRSAIAILVVASLITAGSLAVADDTTSAPQQQMPVGQPMDPGALFLQQNAKKKGVVTLPSGLQYKILKKGKGALPGPNATTYTVNYKGMLTNGQVFDSSYKRGQPLTFPLNGVIQGWQQAMPMMRPGAVWMLYIPANLAYGNQAVPSNPPIPPNSPLIFKVQMISAK